MLNFLDRILSDDDDSAPPEDAGVADGGDVLFDEGGGDDFDDFGGLDGLDEPGFDDGDETGSHAATQELEKRVEEIENEVSSLSSTVNTVRSENEEISETVNGIEENVRKLLDIYEMVTRGVNPFVDEAGAGNAFDGGTFGLFDESDEEESDDDDLDDSVASADAESFFDEDLVEEDEEAVESDQSGGDEVESDPLGGEDGSDGGGKSFADLKAEYDSGDADWVDSVTDEEMDDLGFDGLDDDIDDDIDDDFENDDRSTSPDGAVEADASDEETATVDVEEQNSGTQNYTDGDIKFAEDTLSPTGSATTKPYLAKIPDGYVGDLIVMEWLEFLVEESDPADAARALRYYESIKWIHAAVEDQLRDYLVGFGDVGDAEVDGRAPTQLTMDHHIQSLRYISQLASTTPETVVLNGWPAMGGGPNGRLASGGGGGGLQR